jgi:hypothetical protein
MSTCVTTGTSKLLAMSNCTSVMQVRCPTVTNCNVVLDVLVHAIIVQGQEELAECTSKPEVDVTCVVHAMRVCVCGQLQADIFYPHRDSYHPARSLMTTEYAVTASV